ncbi:DUF3616 domain-containing protein [Spirosoma sp. SC4-14]|uniref:DUF3616 domain-containing protein n=1 Tax=Spirosoma sp. SC4-14 TaxID=3128900 RepID=UPI0030D0EF63
MKNSLQFVMSLLIEQMSHRMLRWSLILVSLVGLGSFASRSGSLIRSTLQANSNAFPKKHVNEAKNGSSLKPQTGGKICITEYMYNPAGSGTTGEFVEITNTGDAAVSMTGWSFDDNSRQAGSFSLSGLGTIQPGESAIITEVSAATFRAEWSLAASKKVVGGNNQNLGRSDEINIYDASNNLVDRLTYDDQTIPGSIRTNGASGWTTYANLCTNNSAGWQLSVVGDTQNSYQSSAGNIGNPGSYVLPLCQGPSIQVASTTTSFLSLPANGPGYVSGVTADPTDPASTLGIDFIIDDPNTPVNNLTVTASSSNEYVVANSNLILTGTGANRNLKIKPLGVGYSTINVVVSGGCTNVTYQINYAASAGFTIPYPSYFHSGTSDGSTAINIDDTYMLVGDDENQTIRLYNRVHSGLPVRGFDFSSSLNLTDGKEVDIEGSIRTGNQIIWIGSQSNNEDGEARPSRDRLFATDISGSGANTSLTYGGRYDYLREDLIAWDANNRHGKGTNYYGFAASAAPGVNSKQDNGYNIEGLELAPDNTTGYVCFRAPLVPTTNRTKALIVPVTNITALVSGNKPVGSATFGAPIELDLGGRGIREMRKNAGNEYVIIAGPTGNATGTPPSDFRIYTWNGDSGTLPGLRATSLTSLNIPGSYEGIAEVPNPLNDDSQIQFLMDNGTTEFYGDGTPSKSLSQPLYKKFRSVVVPIGAVITPPSIAWNKFFQGSEARAIATTSDGGYIAVGFVYSNLYGIESTNYLIVRMDASGRLLWQKIFGGSKTEYVSTVCESSDGGFFIAGNADSNDGDVAGNHGSLSDGWVIKLDQNGNLLWKKAIGGSSADFILGITPTTDGGAIGAGWGYSTDGNISGGHGQSDLWAFRLSANGTVVWSKSFGGSNDDRADAVTRTADGTFAALGYTYSSDGDVTNNHGVADFWVVKFDINGSLLWQKSLGGSATDWGWGGIVPSSDNSLVVAGLTYSNNGDVVGSHSTTGMDLGGNMDYWVAKLDKNGNLVWQRALGGSADDRAESIMAAPDGTFIVTGSSSSNDGDVSGNHGGGDAWTVKLGSNGSLIWQRAVGGSGSDFAWSIAGTSATDFAIAGSSTSTDGDINTTHTTNFWVSRFGTVSSSANVAPLALQAPVYDCQTGAITLLTNGGDGSAITFEAPGITTWTTDPNQFVDKESRTAKDAQPLHITAQQNGVSVNYDFNVLDFCQTGTPLQLLPPTYDCETGSIIFRTMGGDSNVIDYMAAGITDWTTNPNQYVDKESRLASDTPPFTLWARQSGKTVRYVWDLREYCKNGTPLQLLAPTYACSTGAFHFNTSGGDGSTIEYMAAGITGWTTNPDQFVDKESRTASDVQPFVLMARQSGVTTTYVWNLKTACGRARVGASDATSGLQVVVLGNPVVNQQAEIEISGAENKPVQLSLATIQGKILYQYRIPKATTTEHVQVPFGSAKGLLLLEVATDNERKLIKLITP